MTGVSPQVTDLGDTGLTEAVLLEKPANADTFYALCFCGTGLL
jgi:hypothetical protein